MSSIKKYGRTSLEKRLEKSHQCRQIVGEILDFGVNEFQKLKIIHLLSLELEDRGKLLEISNICKDILEEEEENQEKNKLLTV
tara:strand:+ start:994 stop:1242 length:249 start_codon:yes stop_codon:yes gene_type:complete